MPECEIHGGDAYACPPCQGAGQPRRIVRPVAEITITAEFTTRCRTCETTIHPGERITRIRAGDETWWVHEDCAVAEVDS